jgi:hypothetical protein
MPSVDSFTITPDTVACGGRLKISVTATFATSKGGFVTIRVAGDNQCYFSLDTALAESVTLRIPARQGSASTIQAIRCHEKGDTTVSITATADDDTGTSSTRRRPILVTGC